MPNEPKECIMVIGAHAADAHIMAGATIFHDVDAGGKAVGVHMPPGERGYPELSPRDITGIQEVAVKEAATLPGDNSVMMQSYFRFWKNVHLGGGT